MTAPRDGADRRSPQLTYHSRILCSFFLGSSFSSLLRACKKVYADVSEHSAPPYLKLCSPSTIALESGESCLISHH
jgi:hypothetical protein